MRISRRIILSVMLLAGFSAVSAHAASGPLKVAVPALPGEFDPHKAVTAVDRAIAGELFMGLVTRDATGALVPGMASHWDISPDGLTYTFHLRSDARWSDGAAVTARDFAAAFNRALAPETAAPFAGDLFMIRGAAEKHSNTPTKIPFGVDADGVRTLRITLARSSSQFLHVLTQPVAMPLPRHALDKAETAWAAPDRLVSNGPFRLQANGDVIGLAKSSTFFDAVAVLADTVTFVPAATAENAVALIQDEQAHVALGFPFEGIAGRGVSRRLVPETGRSLYGVALNVRRVPWDRRENRHALGMLIDREGIINTLRLSDAVAAYKLVPAELLAVPAPQQVAYGNLPANFRAAIGEVLLAEAKIDPKHPVPMDLVMPRGAPHGAIAKVVVAAWAKAGITARVRELTQDEYEEALRTGAFDAALMASPLPDSESRGFLDFLRSTAGPANVMGYAEPDFDARYGTADAEKDSNIRQALMAEAEVVAVEDQALLPIFFFTPLRARKDVNGWQPNPYGQHPLRFLSP